MKSLAFVLKFARRYTVPLVLTIISMILLVGAQLLIPWIVRSLINTVTSGDLTADSFNTITTLTLIALGVYLVKAGLQFVRS